MKAKKKILAICGSTRPNSTNLNLIKAIADLAADKFEVTVFTGIDTIPHFNPELDSDKAPEVVMNFREKIKQADGVLICTPEYAMGVPGTLKNAIDWTVSSGEFSHKPTTLITASSQGYKGHASLLETLKIIEANITEHTQLVISYAKTKINHQCIITDENTLREVKLVTDELHKLINT